MPVALVHTVDLETNEIILTMKMDWDTAISKYHGQRFDGHKKYFVSMEGGKVPPYKYKKNLLKNIFPKKREKTKV